MNEEQYKAFRLLHRIDQHDEELSWNLVAELRGALTDSLKRELYLDSILYLYREDALEPLPWPPDSEVIDGPYLDVDWPDDEEGSPVVGGYGRSQGYAEVAPTGRSIYGRPEDFDDDDEDLEAPTYEELIESQRRSCVRSPGEDLYSDWNTPRLEPPAPGSNPDGGHVEVTAIPRRSRVAFLNEACQGERPGTQTYGPMDMSDLSMNRI